MTPAEALAHTGDPFAVLTNFSPVLARSMLAFSSKPYESARLSLREFEAARVRTAHINGCMICQGFRAARDLPALLGADASAKRPDLLDRGPVPDESFYRDISDWRESSLFSQREQIAIETAEKMGMDAAFLPHDLAFWERARAAFTEEQIADLVISIGAWIAGGRVLHALGLDTVCLTPTPVAG